MGVRTTLGGDVEQFWAAVRDGAVGTRELEHFDTTMLATHRGGELTQLRSLSDNPAAPPLAVELAAKTTATAVEDASLTGSGLDPDRVGVVFGTVMGTRPAVERW